MRTTNRIFAALGLGLGGLGGSPAPAAPPAIPPAPTLRLPTGPRPTAMALDLTIDPQRPTFTGRAAISLVVPQGTTFLWLNGKGLSVDSATLETGGDRVAATVHAGGEEFLGFALARPVAGAATLRVSYTAPLSDRESHGPYVVESLGDRYVFTQFEETDARRAFPCFDEPGIKVPYQLTLHVPRALTAVSNTLPTETADEEGGMKRVVFGRTPPLPSYLVAWAVGSLEIVDAGKAGRAHLPVAIVTPRGRAREAAFAARALPELVDRLERYFDVPFPYEKLYDVGRPGGGGAMENAGLIISGGGGLIVDPGRETAQFRRRASSTIAHETAHQWFGDLVTTAWWDDTWLNEAFATWAEPKVSALRPDWRLEGTIADGRARAMLADLLLSARQIRQPIESLHDVRNAFDAITYNKGAAVLRMFEGYIGAEAFRKGVHEFLVAHAHGAATTADLVAALSAASGKELAPAFATFVDQPGLPEVAVNLTCAAGKATVTLAQRRYLYAGVEAAAARPWQIPVCVRGAGGARACTLLAAERAELPLATCPAWLVANVDGAGYYVTSYSDDLRRKLVAARAQLSLAEQLAVAVDARVGLVSGRLPAGDALALVERWAPGADDVLLAELVDLAQAVPSNRLLLDAAGPAFARWVQRVFGARARALGVAARPRDLDATRILRGELVPLVAIHGRDAALTAAAVKLAERWLTDPSGVDPDAVSPALRVAASGGDAALAARLLAASARSPGDREIALRALASLGTPAGVRAVLDALREGRIDPRDLRVFGLRAIDTAAAGEAFRYVKENFDALAARLPRAMQAILLASGNGLCSAEDAADFEATFRDRAGKMLGGPRRLAQQKEEITSCAAASALQAPRVAAHLGAGS